MFMSSRNVWGRVVDPGQLPTMRRRPSALDDRQNVLLADDEEVVTLDLELGPGVLGVEDLVALLDVHGLALAVVEDPARAGRQDRALLGLLLGGVRQDDAALGHLLTRGWLDHDAIAQRAQLRGGNGGRCWP